MLSRYCDWKVWKFSNYSTADPSLAVSHWLRPYLDAPGYCLSSDELILIVLRYLLGRPHEHPDHGSDRAGLGAGVDWLGAGLQLTEHMNPEPSPLQSERKVMSMKNVPWQESLSNLKFKNDDIYYSLFDVLNPWFFLFLPQRNALSFSVSIVSLSPRHLIKTNLFIKSNYLKILNKSKLKHLLLIWRWKWLKIQSLLISVASPKNLILSKIRVSS